MGGAIYFLGTYTPSSIIIEETTFNYIYASSSLQEIFDYPQS
jgi:hypothetical protein